ncbi:MAG: LLM class flavin-dependent oxidoreductase [Inquilinus sp.]|uniref:LLM class flavin-dependent oxidoreductase n=1 Tax=Inquilinus sp. TaxID=1932117 RepID=UPI003F2E8796
MTDTAGLRLGIGLDVAALKVPHAGWQELWGAVAERIDGAADFVTLEDGFARSAGDGPDAVLLANWLGARTRDIGVLAGAPVNFLEPFHVSTAIATLDYVTEGRAGLLVQPLRGERAAEAGRAIGRLGGFPAGDPAALGRDALDAVEVIRRLWDSWEDDAVIRDPESQRFLDGAKLHSIDFKGAGFSVLGPSITPRPPQGQPVVAASFTAGDDPALAAAADLVFLRPGAEELRDRIGDRGPLRFADVPADIATRGASSLAAQVAEWSAAGFDGVRFLPRDLPELVETLLPALRQAGLGARGGTLRDRLGLPPAVNRYATAA